MKRPYAIASGNTMILVVAMLLVGCGGGGGDGNSGGGPGPGTGSATVGGSISGVPAGTTLLLVNKSADIINPIGSGSFTFDTKVQAGAQYNVTLFTQPTGLTCSIANAQGTIDNNADPVTNVAVSCQSTPVGLMNYNVGTTVSGLSSGNSVTLLLYGADPLTINANGLAVFSQTLSEEEVPPSGPVVAVGTNPTGQTCIVASAPAASSNFVNVAVTCQ